MRILIEAVVPGEVADSEHSSGLTDEGYMEVVRVLAGLGYDDINIEQA